MPGPPPDPNSRRSKNATYTVLPAEGRIGPTPPWPLSKATATELTVWAELWTRPQATVWEKIGNARIVARYVRLTVQAEKPKAPVTLQSKVMQLEEHLGLTPTAMARLRWTIAADELAGKREEKNDTAPVRRLRAVDPNAVEGSTGTG